MTGLFGFGTPDWLGRIERLSRTQFHASTTTYSNIPPEAQAGFNRAFAKMGDAFEEMSRASDALRDSDGSGEAGETGTGSTEGDSAGPKDIAQNTVQP